MSKRPDLVRVMEVAYDVEKPDLAWLGGVHEAIAENLDAGMGCSAFLYDARDVKALELRAMVGVSQDHDRMIMRAIEASSPERVRWVFRTQTCRTASEGPDWERQPAAQLFRQWGIEDILFVNGLDPSGIGCFFTAKLARRRAVSRATSLLWSHVAAHLAAGYRLQRRLAKPKRARRPAEAAVLSPSGRVEHAEGDAKAESALTALRDSVRALERARGRLRRDDPPEAVRSWRALVSARWSLVDRFESDGRRYVIARSNEPIVSGPSALSERERQVMAYVVAGHWNKLIAYEMGIAPSTVRVLLTRAMAKLGARSRDEAIAIMRRAETEAGGEPER